MQRIEAERVFHLKSGEFAIRAIGFHKELAVLTKEAGMHTVIVEACIVEIPKNGVSGGVIHGVLMLRPMPQLRFGSVAASTGLAADKRGLCSKF